MIRARVVAIAAVAVLAAAIAFFALRPSPYLQYIPWLPRGLGRWADSHGISRNFVAFFTLSFGVLVVVRRHLVPVVALCAFATALEVSQLWIRGRVFDWRDIVVSVAGILIAWPLAWAIARRRAA